MTCRSCGATIADKAIVCYRCGAPTAQPAPVKPAASGSRGRLIFLLVVLAAAIVLLVYTYWKRSFV